MKIRSITVEFLSAGSSDMVYTKENNEGIMVQKTSPYFCLWQNLGEEVLVQVDGGLEKRITKYGCGIFPSNSAQLCRRGEIKTPFHEANQWIYLDIVINGSYRIDDLFVFLELVPKEYEKDIDIYIKEVIRLSGEKDSLCEQLSVVYKIIGILLKIAKNKEGVSSGVLSALNYIKKNYRQNITVAELAKLANLSETHFFRQFKKQTGMSPVAYINEYRLLIAAMLLETTPLHVSTISNKVGFKEAYYFSKLFVKRFNMSPREYRKNITRKA